MSFVAKRWKAARRPCLCGLCERSLPPRYPQRAVPVFIDHRVELESLTCDTYQAPQTGGTMLNATLTVTLPAGTQISWLRDQFLDFADALNLDALIEPWRPQNP